MSDMRAVTRVSSRHARSPLYARQRQLLSLLDALGGVVSSLDFQNLLFLYCREIDGNPPYEFVPYRFGAFSFTSHADRRKLVTRGLLAEATEWRLTKKGRRIARRDRDSLIETLPNATGCAAMRS